MPSKHSTTRPASSRQSTAVGAAAQPAALAQRLGNWNLQQLLQARLVQAKLTVSAPNDVFEQEADRAADQVMRMPEPVAHVSNEAPSLMKRSCDACAAELQRSEGEGAAVPSVDSATEQAIASLSGRGQALPPAVRAFMEPRFNADFSAVRLHTDAHAHQLARSVNAQAFTVGANIVFGAGHFAPQTDRGKHLLAHELSHVLQQAGPRTLQRAPAQRDPDCPGYERGEVQQSRARGVLPMPVAALPRGMFLIADFPVNSARVKSGIAGDPALERWLNLATSGGQPSFTVSGYSDCVGDEHDNAELRLARAQSVAALVQARTKVTCSVLAAPAASYVGSNQTRVGRAMNRSASLMASHPQPQHQQFVRPESVIEMSEALEDADNLLVDPAFLDRRARLRLYGNSPPPKDWKPDERAALLRVDAALDFVKPFVTDANIAQYANDSLKATVMNAFYTSDWLQRAQSDFAEASKLRSQPGVPVNELVAKVSGLLGRRAQAPLKVLAGEAVSFELELGSSPRPAPEFRAQLRQQFAGGASLGKSELRVLAWLQANKQAILDAETTYRIDRRAIAAAIAWEAMKNVMRGSPRSAGPGKMHTYSNALAAVAPFLPKGSAIPQQIEDLGLVTRPADDDAREAVLRMPQGSITYIAAAMRAAADIALQSGYDISHELTALTSFYQGHDLPSWRKHMEKKKKQGDKGFIAADPMAVWTQANLAFLETVLGRPTP